MYCALIHPALNFLINASNQYSIEKIWQQSCTAMKITGLFSSSSDVTTDQLF